MSEYRVPDVRPGRPYVMRRAGRWYVLTIERGVVADRIRDCSEACDMARLWVTAALGVGVSS